MTGPRYDAPFLLLGFALTFGPAAVNAQDAPKPTIKIVAVRPTQTLDANEMFHEYCAVCHGDQEKGNGPAAEALNKSPADLTQIARKNGGRFPEVQVMRVIDGADVVAAHESRAMPTWGHIFRLLEGQETETLRVNALMRYIENLQAR
jgi:mono/diheme cytochrome c family protein